MDGLDRMLKRRPRGWSNQCYNCGGFALRTYEWVDVYEDTPEEVIKQIIAAFPQYCECNPKKEGFDFHKYEYVAYREGKEGYWSDFHFMRSDKLGRWWHKPGGQSIRIYHGDIFAGWVRSGDDNVYRGKIYWLRRER